MQCVRRWYSSITITKKKYEENKTCRLSNHRITSHRTPHMLGIVWKLNYMRTVWLAHDIEYRVSSINIVIVSCSTARINRQNNNLITCFAMHYLFFMGETRVYAAAAAFFHIYNILFCLTSRLPCIQATQPLYNVHNTSGSAFNAFLYLYFYESCQQYARRSLNRVLWQPLPLRT